MIVLRSGSKVDRSSTWFPVIPMMTMSFDMVFLAHFSMLIARFKKVGARRERLLYMFSIILFSISSSNNSAAKIHVVAPCAAG